MMSPGAGIWFSLSLPSFVRLRIPFPRFISLAFLSHLLICTSTYRSIRELETVRHDSLWRPPHLAESTVLKPHCYL
jgi:hypothetical protein